MHAALPLRPTLIPDYLPPTFGDFPGRAAAIEAVTVRARVWGYLDRITFKEGALVKQDDVLFEIDPSTYAPAATQADARLKPAAAQLMQAKRELARNAGLRLRG